MTEVKQQMTDTLEPKFNTPTTQLLLYTESRGLIFDISSDVLN